MAEEAGLFFFKKLLTYKRKSFCLSFLFLLLLDRAFPSPSARPFCDRPYEQMATSHHPGTLRGLSEQEASRCGPAGMEMVTSRKGSQEDGVTG